MVPALVKSLSFLLTAVQQRVIDQIFRDMAQPFPMSRLLQGDVGTGKTVIALCAMLNAVDNGCQATLMAPHRNLGGAALSQYQATGGALGCRCGFAGWGTRERPAAGVVAFRPHRSGRHCCRHPRTNPGRGRVSPPRPCGGRRATSFWRDAALCACGQRAPGRRVDHDRHPNPPDPGADSIRRPGHICGGRASAGTQISAHGPAPSGTARANLRFCRRPDTQRPPGLRDLSAGGGVGRKRTQIRCRFVRRVAERSTAGIQNWIAARPHESR